jgi:hypothetical protein
MAKYRTGLCIPTSNHVATKRKVYQDYNDTRGMHIPMSNASKNRRIGNTFLRHEKGMQVSN